MHSALVLLAFLVFALSVIIYVAVGFMTRPMFDAKNKHKGQTRWKVSKELLQYLQAFTIIYWFLLAVTVITVLVHLADGKPLVANSQDGGCVIVHIILLAILVINAVAVGFITNQVWSKKTKRTHHDGHHTGHVLHFNKSQTVMVQIFVVLTWVMLGVQVLGNISLFGGVPDGKDVQSIPAAIKSTLTKGAPGLTHV